MILTNSLITITSRICAKTIFITAQGQPWAEQPPETYRYISLYHRFW